ncbi:MAG TPA: cytochrome P450 [Xanthobacteraceae bacterium]|nr:cytochrome P450 [Xanthobacteraceae bacterium]
MSQALAEPETYGLFTAAAVRDPYPCYQTMRERDPVHWSEQAQAWYFTRYRDVFELQDRPDLSVDRLETIYSYLPRTNPQRFSDIVAHYNRWLLYRDDAYHDRLKALLLKAMTPRAIERLRPMIERRVAVLLDELQSLPAFDAYLDYAARIPTQVMLDLLGLSSGDEMLMRHWSDRCSNFLFQPVAPDKEAMAQEQRDILDAQQAYFMPLIEQRRVAPGDDLISAMVQAEAGGEKLTDFEILATCNMMATAGGGTSRSAIALSLWWLQRFPAELAKLRADPSLIDLAAEEFLRYDAPTQRGIRTAREDFEVDGRRIREGQILHIMIGAANRDPAQFHDPDRLDITRNPNRHVSLGHGVHYCLGAALARLELRVAVVGFLARFPDYKLATDDIVFMDRTASRRPTSVPVLAR